MLDCKGRAMHFFLSPFPPMVSKNLAASRVAGLFQHLLEHAIAGALKYKQKQHRSLSKNWWEMMTMLLSGIARTSSKDNVRSWIAKFQDHFHFVWLLRLRHRSKTFSFQYTAFIFLKRDEKIVNIIFYKKCLSPLIWFFLLDKLLQALFG